MTNENVGLIIKVSSVVSRIRESHASTTPDFFTADLHKNANKEQTIDE